MRRRRVIVVLVSVASLPVVAALIYFFVPATSFSPEALGYSVVGETGGHNIFESQPCERAAKDGWTCQVWSNVRSGEVNYRVEMDGSRCWHGRRTDAAPDLPREVSGCLKVRDQLRLWDRVF